MLSFDFQSANRRDADDRFDRALIGMMRTSSDEMLTSVRQSRLLVTQTRQLMRRIDESRRSTLFV